MGAPEIIEKAREKMEKEDKNASRQFE